MLLTDGQDSGNISESSRGAALELAANAGVPIFAIGLGDAADVAFLQALADASSGEFYSAPTPADVPGIFDAVGTRLRSAYALSLPLPPSESAERELRVSLELNGTVFTTRAAFQAPGAVISVAQDDGAGVVSWVWAVAALVAVVASMLVGGMLLRRRLRHRSALPGGPGNDVSIARSPREPPSEPSTLSGRLTVVAGPNAGLTVSLDAGPIDIGSASTCGLQLDQAGAAVAGTHARAWLQHDRLMLHHLARTGETLVGGQAIEWAALESDENIEIGPHVITFLLDA